MSTPSEPESDGLPASDPNTSEELAELATEIGDALGALNDARSLEASRLASLIDPSPLNSPDIKARKLRGWLTKAIESLRPASESSAAGRRLARWHNVLKLRYLEGLEPDAVQDRLRISRASFFDSRKQALLELARRLRAETSGGSGPLDSPTFGGFETPLVGRESELSMLKALYEAASSGHGGTVAMIWGEQGIGKTRLARELGRYVESDGGIFLEGRWAAWEGAVPYGAIADGLRQGLFRLSPEERVAAVGPYRRELTRIFPELADDLNHAPPEETQGTEGAQLRFFDGVVALVQTLSAERPLVLLLDDLHLAPQMSLQLHIARRLGELRVLIVYTARRDELLEKPALVAGRNELVKDGLLTDITLEPLTEEQIGRMISYAFGEEVARRVTPEVYRINRGNPFFAVELMRYLVQNRTVRRGESGWQLLDISKIDVPETIKLLVHDRVARLGDDAMTVLQQASVLGRNFSLPALQKMTGLSDADMGAVLDRAVDGGVLVDRSSARAIEEYGFDEDHIRSALYDGIPGPRRRRYHRQAGEALEASHPGRVEELAHHFTNGSDIEKGPAYSFQAAERASAAFSWNRAIPFYRNALDMWEDIGGHENERAEAAEALGNACYQSGIEAQQAMGYLQQALGFYQRLSNQQKVATVRSQLGREHMHSGNLSEQNLATALEHFEEARAILDGEPESMRHGMVYCGLSIAYLDRLEKESSLTWSRRALEAGERLDSPVVTANASVPFGAALALSEPERAREVLEQGWEKSIDHNLGFQADLLRAYAARALGVILKDPKTGTEWIDRRPEYSTTYSLFDIPAHQVAFHAFRGEFKEAELRLDELRTRLGSIGQPAFGLWPDELALLWFRNGEWERASAHLSEALDWTVRSGNRLVECATAQKLGQLFLAQGEYLDAEANLERALALNRDSENLVGELAVLPHLCDLFTSTGRLDEANEALERGHAVEEKLGASGGLQGDLLLAEGKLSAHMKQDAQSEKAFAGAVEVYSRLGLRWDEARAYYEWGAALAAGQDAATDGGRGTELMRKALSEFDAMRATAWVELCRRGIG